MARKSLRRHEIPGHARLLNFACFYNRSFLATDRSRQWLCEAINTTRETQPFQLWAFVIMPDHVHLLLFPCAPVPAILKPLKQSVARRAVAWAKEHQPETLALMRDEQPNGRIAHRFWQRGGGFDRNLWQPRPIWNAIDYLHMNPVRAGLCSTPDEWPWSSSAHFTGRGTSPVALNHENLPPRP